MTELKLNQCLQKLSPLHLKKIAEYYDIILIPFSSQTARKAILAKTESAGFFEQVIEPISADHKNALMLIFFYCRSLTAESINNLIHKSIDINRNVKDIIDDLLKTGFVFYTENQDDGKKYYIIPEELKQVICRYSLSALETFYSNYCDQISRIHKPNKSIFLTLFAIIVTCINHDIKTNLDESLNKRLVNKIHPIAGLETELINYEIIEHYINDLFLFLRSGEFIYPEESDYEVNIKLFDQWLAKPESERLVSLYDFFYRESSNLNFSRFVDILAYLPENQFFEISSLLNLYRIFFDITESQIKHFSKEPRNFYYILILYLLGIIEFTSVDVHNYCAWRITEFGMSLIKGKPLPENQPEFENKIIIQPNFELIASRNADLMLLWKIYRFADIFQCDHMLRFNISRLSLYRGLSNNLKSDEVTNILEKYAKETISQNVLYSLKEWCSDFGSIYFMDVFLLRCKNKNIADQIKLNPKTRDFVKGNFSQTDLIVERTDFETLMEILKSQGLMPLKNIITYHDIEEKNELLAIEKRSKPKTKKTDKQTITINLEKIRFLPEIL